MTENEENSKRYDLEERTFRFTKEVREFARTLPRGVANEEDIRQLVKASGSVGANYIEANDCLSQKDFMPHMKSSRKEAQEGRSWPCLLDTGGREPLEKARGLLIQEATELMNILGSIARKSQCSGVAPALARALALRISRFVL